MRFQRVTVVLAMMAACSSSPPLPVDPQISVSPTGDYFGTDLCLGTYIGEAPEGDVTITNGGQNPLTLTAVSMSAPSVFTLTGPVMLLSDGGSVSGTPMTIGSEQSAFLQVIFAPTDVEKYTGTITITSNAQNSPELVVPLRGVGVPDPLPDGNYQQVPPDAGISADCTGDGGQTS